MPYTYSGLQAGGNYGDYYRGDYYRGDIWSTIGGAVKKAAGAVVGGVSGFISGGPLGAIKGGLTGAGILKSSAPPANVAVMGTALAPLPPQTTFGGVSIGGERGIRVGVERAAYVTSTGMSSSAPMMSNQDGCPKGYHRNKSDYWTKSEGFVAAGSKCVRNRRMNVVNPRALRRGIRRAKGAVKLLRKSAGSMGYSVVAKRAPKMRKR